MSYRANAKCTKCDKWIRSEEQTPLCEDCQRYSRESETEQKAEEKCNADDCSFETASPTAAEFEELFLADAELVPMI